MSLASSAKLVAFTPEELRRRCLLRRGLQLTIMVCGESGIGKTSFVKMLAGRDSFDEPFAPQNESGVDPQVTIQTHHALVVEEETPISLDVVMAPGFGDKIDNRRCANTIVDYLERQFDDVLNEECRIQRNSKAKDTRVHALLYFIRPTGKGLRQLDINFMKAVGSRCNLIPVIAKADTMTKEELATNKRKIYSDLLANGVDLYDFGALFEDSPDDELTGFDQLIPFAVMGSTTLRETAEGAQYVREYPWGTAVPENVLHSDFLTLKTLLFGTCMQDLKDTTRDVIYERYRTDRLCNSTKTRTVSGTNAFSGMLDKIKEESITKKVY